MYLSRFLPLLALLAAACGGDDGGGDGGGTANTAPTVNAGADQTVSETDTVELDATVTDAEGDATLQWSQVSGPDITFSNTGIEDPSFVAPDVDAETEIVLRLTADDGVNAAVADDVTITVLTASFSAEAGLGQIVAPGVEVTLDATVNDADGTATILWEQIGGTSVTLSDATAEDPAFTAPSVASSEDLIFQLTVDNGVDPVVVDTVQVEVWIGLDNSLADPTALADFSDRDGWQCTVAPATDSTVSFTENGDTVEVSANGIASHTTGEFPNDGNPNSITAQSVSYEFTLSPEKTSTATEMAEFGVTVDGVKLERDTAESYNNAGAWRYEAVTVGLARGDTSGAEFAWLGTDCNNAHVQPTGQYHYHGLMEGLINAFGEVNGAPDDMVLGGYAADGFPFYIRYGYTDPDDPSSGLTVVTASWELKSGIRPDGPGGAYDGTFREDWEFVEGSGDLDECGGRFGPTPEYPGGIYHYYITDDYPFIPRCVFGTPDASFRTGGP